MASNLYLTVAEFKNRIDAVSVTWSDAESTAAERIIEAVSRNIDRHCGRFFYTTATGTVKYYQADDGAYVCVDDLVSIDTSGLTTDEDGDRTYETTWAATDYDLTPYNAAAVGDPYTELCTTPAGRYSFPTIAKGVKITGSWGWPTTPPEVVEACFLEAARTWQHAHSPSGVSASSELGSWIVEPMLHPKTQAMLRHLRKNLVAFV
jgi:hypothetical protein